MQSRTTCLDLGTAVQETEESKVIICKYKRSVKKQNKTKQNNNNKTYNGLCSLSPLADLWDSCAVQYCSSIWCCCLLTDHIDNSFEWKIKHPSTKRFACSDF